MVYVVISRTPKPEDLIWENNDTYFSEEYRFSILGVFSKESLAKKVYYEPPVDVEGEIIEIIFVPMDQPDQIFNGTIESRLVKESRDESSESVDESNESVDESSE